MLVVSPGFAFRGPLAVAFIQSFHGGIEVFGCASGMLVPAPEVTRRMLWESFLEEMPIPVLAWDEALAQHWDAVIGIHSHKDTLPEGYFSKQVLMLQAEALTSTDVAEARSIRDHIKNEIFILLRDRLRLKPGSV